MAHELNPAQREAAFTLAGPLLVLAGAGTGKTRVVTYRIAELVRRGTSPGRILAVTFTNKAAKEMQERAAKLLGKRLPEKPQISTFHSLCVRILRRHIMHLGYPAQFPIYDRGDQESVTRAALREAKVANETLRPGDLIHQIGRWKTHGLRPPQAAQMANTDKEHLAAVAYKRYQKALQAAGAVDFDDLLLCSEELFTKFPEVRREEAGRFDHLMIDEYQDTNGSQYRIVKALAAGHRNLCVVGDDDQSIYGWRGAEVAHILRFKQDWPEAKVVRLEENYRSTHEIVEWANRLIAYNRDRHAKVLRAARSGGARPCIRQFKDEATEAREIVGDIQSKLAQGGVQARDFAILLRTNEQPRAFEVELRKAKVPYVLIGGMSFYDRREVRDVLAYLKLLIAPQDEVALRRVINTPPRGIGGKSVEQLLAHAVSGGIPLWDAMRLAGTLSEITPHAAKAISDFQSLIGRHQARLNGEPLAAVAADLIQQIGYQQELARQYDDPQEQQSRWAAVEGVVNALAGYERRGENPSLGGFLDEIALEGRDDDKDKEGQLARNAVALMTLHSAKGLEFSQVYLVGMEEGLLPHHRAVAEEGPAIDEERRLCYVGMTRAQDRLTMSMALSRMKWGKSRDSKPSRFLFEMTGMADNPATKSHANNGKKESGKVENRVAGPATSRAGGSAKSARGPRPPGGN